MATPPPEITQLLLRWTKGNVAAFDEVVSLVYPELRKMARRYMRREDPAHTLQTSALVNEAYLRLVDQQHVEWKDRAHFFAFAAQVMRHILIDHARSFQSAKRGAGVEFVPLEEGRVNVQQRAAELIALHEALMRLAALDPRKSQIVELRFFGGLSLEETAEVVKLSRITVAREWRSAKAWLYREVSGEHVAGLE